MVIYPAWISLTVSMFRVVVICLANIAFGQLIPVMGCVIQGAQLAENSWQGLAPHAMPVNTNSEGAITKTVTGLGNTFQAIMMRLVEPRAQGRGIITKAVIVRLHRNLFIGPFQPWPIPRRMPVARAVAIPHSTLRSFLRSSGLFVLTKSKIWH
jgi:hypothetical protein